MHVAIIGGGAAGLASARLATDAKYGFTCEVFEQTDVLGGTWVYTDEVGLDEYGLPIHTSMYNALKTNLPKEIMNFPDYKFPDYPTSYMSRDQVLEYLNNYASHFNLNQYIKYRHEVKLVRPLPNNRWSVTVRNLRTKVDTEKEFDGILVCNGHFNVPYIPDYLSKNEFKGLQMHSHNYRKPNEFKDKTVLVVGGGSSGFDIALQLLPFATKIIFSVKVPRNIPLPEKIIAKPKIAKLTEHGPVFIDGSIENVDVIIYCTGYKYDFPFLSNDCGIKVEKNSVQPLYKQVINIEKPTMGFIGLVFIVLPFQVFYFQISLFLAHLKGLIQLPTKEEMLLDMKNDMEVRLAAGFPEHHRHKLAKEFQAKYFDDLANVAKIKPVLPVIMKIYLHAITNPIRNTEYKIIDDEHYELVYLKNI